MGQFLFCMMYTRKEVSLIRKKFWTSFGQYMRPVSDINGNTINWLNYKTGLKDLYFRLDATNLQASIAIELRHTDAVVQQHYFEQLQQTRSILEKITGEEWDWQLHLHDDDGNIVSRVSKTLSGLNIFNEAYWPAIISFLKPRIIALHKFWMRVKDGFEG